MDSYNLPRAGGPATHSPSTAIDNESCPTSGDPAHDTTMLAAWPELSAIRQRLTGIEHEAEQSDIGPTPDHLTERDALLERRDALLAAVAVAEEAAWSPKRRAAADDDRSERLCALRDDGAVLERSRAALVALVHDALVAVARARGFNDAHLATDADWPDDDDGALTAAETEDALRPLRDQVPPDLMALAFLAYEVVADGYAPGEVERAGLYAIQAGLSVTTLRTQAKVLVQLVRPLHRAGRTVPLTVSEADDIVSKFRTATDPKIRHTPSPEERLREAELIVAMAAADANPVDELLAVSAVDLVAAHLDYRPAIIDGLMREGESMNVIASPKVGKSWLVLAMAFSVANGVPFLGWNCAKGAVLIIDNELHPETESQRLKAVAAALSLPLDGIHIVSLRGALQDLPTLQDRLERTARRIGAKLIVLDALYRLIPADVKENENGGMTQLYNVIDRIARTTGAGVVSIHHASKGSQSDKSVTDGGAGAGAVARAADSHVFLREHETEGLVVMDAVARSFPPPTPLVITRPGLVWEVVSGADPKRLKGRKAKAPSTVSPEDLRNVYIAQYPEPVKVIMARIKGCGLAVPLATLEGMLGLAASSGDIVCEIGPRGAKLYGRELSPGGNGTIVARVQRYISDHPEATRAEIATACDCSVKSVSRARGEG